jgi:hypothetical protein
VDLIEEIANFISLDCGVDTDIVAFVCMMSDYREQQAYCTWLQKLRGFSVSP